MVKVVSFSLWGNESRYTIGSLKNADLAKEFYPDFECWFYIHKPSVPQNIIDELAKRDNVKIFFKDGDINTTKPMMWRFEPITNPEVEVMLSRDTDTRILPREKLAVDEWLQSDKLLHSMRDHPHHNFKIQAGMWGIKQNNLCNWIELMANFSQNNKSYNRFDDQNFLTNYIYPIYSNTLFVHATFNKIEPFAKNFPIPYCQNYKFVGEYVYADDSRSPQHIQILIRSLRK